MLFIRPLFNLIADEFISCTIENREVSLANSLAFDDKPSDKSLIYIEKSSGLWIDSWQTPALVFVKEEDWPLSVTLYFLLLRKSDKMFRKSSEIPFCLSLNIIPSWQTLSKALDISKKTLPASNPSSKNE